MTPEEEKKLKDRAACGAGEVLSATLADVEVNLKVPLRKAIERQIYANILDLALERETRECWRLDCLRFRKLLEQHGIDWREK